MFKIELETNSPDIRLVRPDVERDAALGVEWLSGEKGKETMRLMGVNMDTFQEPTLEAEKERVTEFLTKTDELNWMIEKEGKVVGSIWVKLTDHETVPAPSIHLMIGDPTARGGGVGSESMKAVLNWLITDQRNEQVYSRYMTTNEGSAHLLAKLGFETTGEIYSDNDGLEWQNTQLDAKNWGEL